MTIKSQAYEEPTGLAKLVGTVQDRLQDFLFDKKEFTVTTRRTPEGYSHNVVYDGVVNNIPTYIGEVIVIQKMNEEVLKISPTKNTVESTSYKFEFRPSKLFR